MITTTLTAREFNQDTGGAKKAAEKGPVIITDRGTPSHVLLTYEEFQKLQAPAPSLTLLDALSQKEEGDFEFDPPRMSDAIFKPVDFD